MSWMEKLYQTYEHGIKSDSSKPWPISHFVKTAHIEVVIDVEGNFKNNRITLLSGEDASTLIPATEASAGRAGAKIAPHPLCDEIGYCASDFPDVIQARSGAYLNQLKEWCLSEYTHPKIVAIYKYLEKKNLWQDLIQEIEFPLTFTNRRGQKTKISAEKAFVRWKVEELGNPCSGTWEDSDLVDKWIEFDKFKNSKMRLCFITGENARLIENHSRFIRNSSDGAKLISSNDDGGYTYRGKFLNNTEACSIGFDVSQKAHNALRWLISLQGFRSGDKEPQIYVSWAVSGKPIPEPWKDTLSVFDSADAEFDLDEIDQNIESEQEQRVDHGIDLGQSFALKLRKYMSGYFAELNPTEQIIIMGIDSATPGRMGIIYYRELFSHEFLKRLEIWHRNFAWQQNYGWDSKAGKKIQFVGVPSPKDISEVAYGHRDDKGALQLDDKLQKATVARLLPCIIDALPIPRDLVELTFRRACNRIGMKKRNYNGRSFEDDWGKTLGIACALFKGYYLRHPTEPRTYQMELENRTTRDYLYGRLLAIADYLEHQALHLADESRDTNAAKLMQRFADHPYSTWRNIELSLNPYQTRLRSKKQKLLGHLEKTLDEVYCLFKEEEFMDDKKLSGEFLLGFHCQRQALWNKPEKPKKEDPENTDNEHN